MTFAMPQRNAAARAPFRWKTGLLIGGLVLVLLLLGCVTPTILVLIVWGPAGLRATPLAPVVQRARVQTYDVEVDVGGVDEHRVHLFVKEGLQVTVFTDDPGPEQLWIEIHDAGQRHVNIPVGGKEGSAVLFAPATGEYNGRVLNSGPGVAKRKVELKMF